jgi:hypothetical protein
MTTTTYVGTNGPDAFNVDPTLGSYVITTGGGQDDIVLGPVSPTFQPTGTITITGFQAGLNGDHLDLLTFLRSISPSATPPNVTDTFRGPLLRIAESGADTIIQMNPGGSGAWTDFIVLKDVDPNVLTWANFPGIGPAGTPLVPALPSLEFPDAVPPVTNDPAQVPSPTSVTIGPGTATDNLVGTSGDDILIGGPSSLHGEANDTFYGNGGNDRMFGNGGFNTAIFDGVFRQYAFASGSAPYVTADGYIYQVAGGPEGGTDTLVDIQRIQFVDGYIATSPTDLAGQVYRLYEAALNRAPDPSGLANWVNALNTGTSLQSVVNGFVGSQEFQNTYGSLDNTAFVTLLYNNALHRGPDATGLSNWVGMLNSGQDTRAQVVLGFSESNENIAASTPAVQQGLWVGNVDAAEVARLYDTVFSRLPDLAGLTDWTQSLETGMTLLQVTQGFVGSNEFQSTYGALNNNQFVELLYQNSLHREADAAGLNNWVNALTSGQDTRAQVVMAFSESAEHIADTAGHIDGGIWVRS